MLQWMRRFLRPAVMADQTFPVLDLAGTTVAEIKLSRTDGKLVVWRTTFINSFSMPVTEAQARTISEAAKQHDWAALDRIGPEFLPWYCRKCACNYRADAWTIRRQDDDDGWVDSYQGCCPNGHRRMIAD